MSLARRIAEHFVVPADGRATPERLTAADGRSGRADITREGAPPTRGCAVAPPRTPASVAVLAAASEAPAVGGGLGLVLARHARAPAAIVCIWSAAPGRPLWRVPALPAAGRLASALAARGNAARGSGRLVVVRLADGSEAAAAQARRVAAAAGAAPIVLALAGPRPAAFDALLDEQDLVVVAVAPGANPALARLAVAGLRCGVVCEIPLARPGRSLAGTGVALVPSARRALAAPLEALSR
jgi:hypothetical protein